MTHNGAPNLIARNEDKMSPLSLEKKSWEDIAEGPYFGPPGCYVIFFDAWYAYVGASTRSLARVLAQTVSGVSLP